MDRDQLLERALSFEEEGDWAAAADLLREHLGDFEDDAAVYCWLGVAERELGLEGVAYERFKTALSLEPVDPYILATAGSGIAAFDDPEAEQALRAAALTAPAVPLTRLLYGAYLSREGLFEESAKELVAASELDPENPAVHYELGVLRALAHRMEGAADALADAVRLGPQDGWVRVVFGLVLVEADRLEEGAGELLEGARLLDDDTEAQLVAAAAAGAVGREAAAYEMLERARLRAEETDLVVVVDVEDRLDAGPEACRELLLEEFGPSALRSRLRTRP